VSAVDGQNRPGEKDAVMVVTQRCPAVRVLGIEQAGNAPAQILLTWGLGSQSTGKTIQDVVHRLVGPLESQESINFQEFFG